MHQREERATSPLLADLSRRCLGVRHRAASVRHRPSGPPTLIHQRPRLSQGGTWDFVGPVFRHEGRPEGHGKVEPTAKELDVGTGTVHRIARSRS